MANPLPTPIPGQESQYGHEGTVYDYYNRGPGGSTVFYIYDPNDGTWTMHDRVTGAVTQMSSPPSGDLTTLWGSGAISDAQFQAALSGQIPPAGSPQLPADPKNNLLQQQNTGTGFQINPADFELPEQFYNDPFSALGGAADRPGFFDLASLISSTEELPLLAQNTSGVSGVGSGLLTTPPPTSNIQASDFGGAVPFYNNPFSALFGSGGDQNSARPAPGFDWGTMLAQNNFPDYGSPAFAQPSQQQTGDLGFDLFGMPDQQLWEGSGSGSDPGAMSPLSHDIENFGGDLSLGAGAEEPNFTDMLLGLGGTNTGNSTEAGNDFEAANAQYGEGNWYYNETGDIVPVDYPDMPAAPAVPDFGAPASTSNNGNVTGYDPATGEPIYANTPTNTGPMQSSWYDRASNQVGGISSGRPFLSSATGIYAMPGGITSNWAGGIAGTSDLGGSAINNPSQFTPTRGMTDMLALMSAPASRISGGGEGSFSEMSLDRRAAKAGFDNPVDYLMATNQPVYPTGWDWVSRASQYGGSGQAGNSSWMPHMHFWAATGYSPNASLAAAMPTAPPNFNPLTGEVGA